MSFSFSIYSLSIYPTGRGNIQCGIKSFKKRFVLEGLDAALDIAPTSRVYRKRVDGEAEAHLIAIACGKPPNGYARWSLRLLADRMVELEYVDVISHETVRKVLKKTNLSLGK